jgi:hypothetical protein
MQRGLTAYDRPHRFVLSAVSQLPFGRGRPFFSKTRGFWGKVIGGWDNSMIVSRQSGALWNLPANVIQLKDPRRPLNWGDSRVQAIEPCVLRWNENNTVTMMRFSEVDHGCKEAHWLIVPRFNPRYTPFRSPNIRLQPVFMMDTSLNKTAQISEKLRVQFRAEVFNLMNSFFLVSSQFNNNPENVNFGTIEKAAVSAPQSNYPRQIQLAIKLLW